MESGNEGSFGRKRSEGPPRWAPKECPIQCNAEEEEGGDAMGEVHEHETEGHRRSRWKRAKTRAGAVAAAKTGNKAGNHHHHHEHHEHDHAIDNPDADAAGFNAGVHGESLFLRLGWGEY